MREITCYDKLVQIVVFGFLLLLLINVSGFFITYFTIKKKVYHTYFLQKANIEKLHNVKI